MRQIRTSGLTSGEGKRGHWPSLNATAPFLDSTIPGGHDLTIDRPTLLSTSWAGELGCAPLTHESHPTPPGREHHLTTPAAAPPGAGNFHARREHRVRQAGGGSLGRRKQSLAYAPSRVSQLRRNQPRGLAGPDHVRSVRRRFAAWRCRVCAALSRSGKRLLGQQRLAQLPFERRLRRVVGADRQVAQSRFQSDFGCRATLLSDHGRRTPLPAARASLHSLDDGQLAKHARYALLLSAEALGRVAQEQRPKPQSIRYGHLDQPD